MTTDTQPTTFTADEKSAAAYITAAQKAIDYSRVELVVHRNNEIDLIFHRSLEKLPPEKRFDIFVGVFAITGAWPKSLPTAEDLSKDVIYLSGYATDIAALAKQWRANSTFKHIPVEKPAAQAEIKPEEAAPKPVLLNRLTQSEIGRMKPSVITQPHLDRPEPEIEAPVVELAFPKNRFEKKQSLLGDNYTPILANKNAYKRKAITALRLGDVTFAKNEKTGTTEIKFADKLNSSPEQRTQIYYGILVLADALEKNEKLLPRLTFGDEYKTIRSELEQNIYSAVMANLKREHPRTDWEKVHLPDQPNGVTIRMNFLKNAYQLVEDKFTPDSNTR